MAAQDETILDVPAEVIARNRDEFVSFFEGIDATYRSVVDRVLAANKKRVLVNLDDLRTFDAQQDKRLTHSLITNPREFLHALELAARSYVRDVMSNAPSDITVGITGPIGDSEVTPRNLTSRFLGQIVCLDGIVTKTSLVNPRLKTSVQFCPQTGKMLPRSFPDPTDLTRAPRRAALQQTDADGNPLEMEFGFSEFIDHQLLTIQERPETAPAGQMPRSCDVVADRDLADACKPGDRVRIYGVYVVSATGLSGVPGGVYRAVLIANNIEVSNKSVEMDLTEDDERAVAKVAKRKDITELLARSLAPSICGHDLIKEALVLMLAGGTECDLDDGTHIRGDVNVLMVGDPSTAKSQLLRHILAVAPLAVHTTGRGSSGVGLTAAVSSDPETGERRLEAGAMVIADRGVVCIDEFDKMDEADRVAIHEALEQQTVTISKAGIHTSLHARCSVCAAANPIWGNYNPSKSPMDNIGLPGSLLSRFDLLFIVLDYHDPRIDATIADHVLRSHKWRGQVAEVSNGIFVQPDPLLHGNDQEDFLTHEFLKKYITVAKRKQPELTQKAISEMVKAWSELRTIEGRKTQPVTARAFETLLRLATAHAKVRLANQVTVKDAKEAIKLLHYAIFGDVEKAKKKGRKKKVDSDEEGDDYKPKKTRTSRRKKSQPSQEPQEEAEDGSEPEEEQAPPQEEKHEEIDHQTLMTEVYIGLLKRNLDKVTYDEFQKRVEAAKGFVPTEDEMNKFFKPLADSDKVMLLAEDGGPTIYFLS